MRDRRFRRLVLYPLQAAAIRLGLALFGALSIDRASALGGWLGRSIGPRLKATRVAERNLRRAFPERSDAEIATIVRRMWDHLGRVAAESPHLGEVDIYADNGRVEVVGVENVDRLRDDGIGGIFFSAHLGNWEISTLGAKQRGMPITHIYRAANNPFVEPILRRLRKPLGGTHHPKGAEGAKALIAALRRGEHLGLIVDQKFNDGIAVPFFGRAAMTAPAPAQLALKFKCPMVPVRVERLEGARFRLTIHPPMELPETGDRQADVAAIMTRVNALFEEWIRARPEQWLWLHRRWPE
jgi:KDO2-lipid IV(A) lauroyltransferase